MATSKLIAVALLVLGVVQVGHAYSTYQAKIPNGAAVERNGVVYPGVGHMASIGGGTLNVFGELFKAQGHVWTFDLCNNDTDKDGWTTGAELGDPACVWIEGGSAAARSTNITDPGFNDTFPMMPLDVEVTGYLSDLSSVENGTVVATGANMKSSPWKHTVQSALSQDSQTSGYTILVEKVISATSLSSASSALVNHADPAAYAPSTTPTFQWIFKLSDAANKIAISYLEGLAFSRNNIMVTAKGKLNKDATLDLLALSATGLADLSPSSLTLQTYTGFIVDSRSFLNQSLTLASEPYKHMTKAVLHDKSAESGFVILQDDNVTNSFSNSTSPLVDMANWDVQAYDSAAASQGVRSFSPLVNFTESSNAKAKKFLEAIPKGRSNLLVTVTGVLLADGKFDLATIVDLSPKTLPKVTIVGYLADNLCVQGDGIASDGANMTSAPFHHTAKCSLMQACIDSGYTILTPTNYTGDLVNPFPENATFYEPLPDKFSDWVKTFTYASLNAPDFTFKSAVNLSASANLVAIKWLKRWPDHKNNLLIKVEGVLDQVGNLTDIEIETVAKKLRMTGYLADRLTLKNGTALECPKANMTKDPWNHARECTLKDDQKGSGFTLMVDTNATSSYTDPKWSPLVNLTSPDEVANFAGEMVHDFKSTSYWTDKANKMAVAYLEGLQKERRNLLVTVEGELLDDNEYETSKISDAVERVIVIGFLSDRLTWDNGTSWIDNTTPIPTPAPTPAPAELKQRGALSQAVSPTPAPTAWKCIDPWNRCTDQWCYDNCNHPGAQHCPPSYCQAVSSTPVTAAPTSELPIEMEKTPWKRTVKSNLVQANKDSGYAVLRSEKLQNYGKYSGLVNKSWDGIEDFKPENGNDEKVDDWKFERLVNLTTAGNGKATQWLSFFPLHRANLLVKITGRWIYSTNAEGETERQLDPELIEDYSPMSTLWEGFLTCGDFATNTARVITDGSTIGSAPWNLTATEASWTRAGSCGQLGYTLITDTNTTNSLSTKEGNPLNSLNHETVPQFRLPEAEVSLHSFTSVVSFTPTSNNKLQRWVAHAAPNRNALIFRFFGVLKTTDGGATMKLDLAKLEDVAPKNARFYGFLAGIKCVDKRTAENGADLWTEPWKNKVEYARSDACKEDGYTLLQDMNSTMSLSNPESQAVSPTSTPAPTPAQAVLSRRGALSQAVSPTPAPTAYKCIDPWNRCTDQWCYDNCNHAGAQHCPPSYCQAVSSTPVTAAVSAPGYTMNPLMNPLMNKLDKDVENFEVDPARRFTPGVNLTEDGSKEAEEFLKKLPEKRNNILVAIAGGIDINAENQSIAIGIVDIEDLAPKTTRLVEFTAFLVARKSLGLEKMYGPWNQTVKELRLDDVKEEGYTTLVDTNETLSYSNPEYSPMVNLTITQVKGWRWSNGEAEKLQHKFKIKYNFTEASTKEAAEWLEKRPGPRNNILVKIKGQLDLDERLMLTSIEDLSEPTTPEVEVIGYLADKLCVKNKIAFDGADMVHEPWKHTVKCATMAQCKASGFTILMDQTTIDSFTTATSILINMPQAQVQAFTPTTQHTFAIKYNLTMDQGTAEAEHWLEKLPDTRNNLLVKVSGWLVENGEVEVKNIEDLSFQTSPVIKISGYLASSACTSSRYALDGADMWYAPWNHTVASTLLPQCVTGGFVIMQDTNLGLYSSPSSALVGLTIKEVRAFQPATGHKFNSSWSFSAKANAKAEAFLRTLPGIRNNILVQAEGYVPGGVGATYGTIDALEFKDLSENTAPVVSLVGILADQLCMEKRIAFDGADMKHEPWKHSVKCMLMDTCVASGYALLADFDTTTGSFTGNSSVLVNQTIKEAAAFSPSPVHTFRQIANFTNRSNQLIVEWLGEMLPHRNNILVELRGAWEVETGLFDLAYINDLSPHTGPHVADIGKGFQRMLTGLHRGGILNSDSSNMSTWTTTSGTKICTYDGVGYSCDFSIVVPPMQGTMDISQLPSGITKLKIKRQGISGALPMASPFLGAFSFLTDLSLAQNGMTGTVESSTFDSMNNAITNLDLSFNEFDGALRLVTAPSALTALNIAGNNFTNGDVRVTGGLATTLALSLEELGSIALRRRLTGYSANSLTIVYYDCGKDHPAFKMQLSDGTYLDMAGGAVIPTHCAGCHVGYMYNVADASCPSVNASAPSPSGSASSNVVGSESSNSRESVNIAFTPGEGTCDAGCVAVIIAILVFLLVLVIVAVLIRVVCKPAPAKNKNLDEMDAIPESHDQNGRQGEYRGGDEELQEKA